MIARVYANGRNGGNNITADNSMGLICNM